MLSRYLRQRLGLRRALELGRLHDLKSWREALVETTTLMVFWAYPFSVAATSPILLQRGWYHLLILNAFIWLWSLVAVLSPRKELRPKAWQVMTVIALSTVSFHVSMGPFGARPAWILGTVIFAALLYGGRGAVLAALGGGAMLAVMGWVLPGISPSWAELNGLGVATWASFITNTTTWALAAGVPTALLTRGLDRTLRNERQAHADLLEERAQLELVNARLRDEMYERERLAAHLHEAQKLEAVGRFAGGIAHDLNNLLVPVLTLSEMLEECIEDTELREDIRTIIDAAESASSLVQQILQFGRRSDPPDSAIELNRVLASVVKRARVGTTATVRLLEVAPSVQVLARPVALEQAFGNLVTNAVQALGEDGGEVTVGLEIATMLEASNVVDVSSGEERSFACVTVSDNGIGMSPDTQTQIFEPFFTTKPLGKGTGLGLATTHNIITHHDGAIVLESELSVGTTFRVYLPLLWDEDDPQRPSGPVSTELIGGKRLEFGQP